MRTLPRQGRFEPLVVAPKGLGMSLACLLVLMVIAREHGSDGEVCLEDGSLVLRKSHLHFVNFPRIVSIDATR